MATKKNKNVTSGKIVYNSSIVKGIVVLAVSEVDGVASDIDRSGKTASKDEVKVTFTDGKNVDVDVIVTVKDGFNIPDVAYNIQQSIKHNVETMSDYKIKNVDVHVVDVVYGDND
ncbi:MAG: Asp23/Gls24 family envelope stress response protein [Candidatus Borkfalkiaceae bacterium]|nr:Asp23/Gls24 family envelope stress response protein [Christensenellaceae bacterium]